MAWRGCLLVLVTVGAIHFYYRASLALYLKALAAKGESLVPSELAQDPCINHNATARVFAALDKLHSPQEPFPKLMQPIIRGKAAVSWKQPSFLRKSLPEEHIQTILTNLHQECISLITSYQPLILGPNQQKVIILANYLSAFTGLYLANGKPREALACVEGGLRLVLGMNNQPTAIVTDMKIRSAYKALEATWELLQYDGWSDNELKHLQDLWQRLELRSEIVPALRMERAMAYQEISKVNGADLFAGFSPSASHLFAMSLQKLVSLEFEQFFSTANQAWVAAVKKVYWVLFGRNKEELLILKAYQELIERLEQTPNHLPIAGPFSRTDLSDFHVMAKAFYPYYDSLLGKLRLVETQRDLTVTAIGLQRYKLHHRDYPATLKQLEPDFLQRPAFDRFTGSPLQYRKQNEFFLLYSVGPDQEDDGGKPDYNNLKHTEADLVWPRPASDEELLKYHQDRSVILR